MSTEQENFDDLLKSKLNESEFAFNEANWDKAETLIIQAEKKRKRRLIGFIFFIGMFLGVCLMAPFIVSKDNVEKKDLNSENKKLKIENKVANKVETENKTENNSKILKTDADAKTRKENDKIASLPSNAVHENVNNKTQLKKNKETIIKPNSSQQQLGSSTETVSTEIKKGVINKTKEQEGRREGHNNGSPSILNEKQKIEVAEANNNKKEEKSSEKEGIENNLSLKNENPNIVKQALDSTKALVLVNNNFKKDTIVTAKDSIVKIKADSVTPAVNDATEIFKKTTLFNIDAGANYAFGWSNNAIKEAAGFNAVFGVSVAHQFAKKWGLLIGVQYNSLAHLNYSNYTSNNLQYDFGYNQTKTVITPTILYYLTVPLKLQYHFNDKNSLSIGVNTLYLLNTNSRVENYTQGVFAAPSNRTSTKTGYMDGFVMWDIQPALAYRRRIFKGLYVSAEVYYGLIDIKKNSVFGPIKSEHNSGLKLILSYNLLHK